MRKIEIIKYLNCQKGLKKTFKKSLKKKLRPKIRMEIKGMQSFYALFEIFAITLLKLISRKAKTTYLKASAQVKLCPTVIMMNLKNKTTI
jgi:hypothetical protein